MKGDMYLAKASDEEILKRGECGGAVTALLKFALESKTVDAAFAVKRRDGNRYDGVLDLITDPGEVIECAGAFHCAPVNIARNIKEYLDGAKDLRIAVPCKPCDARAIIELAKREQINIENIILIGLNCTGTLSPAIAKRMLIEEYEVNPANVVREDIDDGKLIITLGDGTKKERDLDVLEEKGYGRRDNCRRCDVNIPRMADAACGKWGVERKKATFIEVCSEKGSDLIEGAIEANYIEVEPPGESAMEEREKKDKEAIDKALKWQEKDFADLESNGPDGRFDYWLEQFNRCIKCFGCRDACPICYCKSCSLEADRGVVKGGEVPPDLTFPMIRIVHVADSCVNCGQCQDACPMELPLSRLTFYLSKKLGDIFKYEPGMDVSALPPLATVTDEELEMAEVEVDFSKLM